MGWKIFVHSVRQVFGNIAGAMRVSVVLFVVQLCLVGLATHASNALNVGSASIEVQVLGALIQQVLSIVIVLWIAVGWHRYVLLGEAPGLIPRFRMDRMLGYLGIGILIALVMIVPVVLVTFVLMRVAPALMNGLQFTSETVASIPFQLRATLLLTLFYIPITAWALRLATILPAVALERGKGAFDGLIATQDQNGAYFGLAAVCVICYLLAALPLVLMLMNGVVAQVYQVILGWVTMMLGLSILTTLYAHFIEKCPLA